MKYPEHQKLKAVKDESQALGEFLDWLKQKEITLCQYSRADLEYLPVIQRTDQVLADYFEIDLDKIEQEKQTMVKALHALAEPCPWCKSNTSTYDGEFSISVMCKKCMFYFENDKWWVVSCNENHAHSDACLSEVEPPNQRRGNEQL